MAMELGDARPADFYKERLLIVDMDDFLTRPKVDVTPFHSMLLIVRTTGDLTDTLDNRHQQFCVVLILSTSTQPMVENFLRDYILTHRNVTRLHLFFIEGNALAIAANNKPYVCHPINSRVTLRSRVACRDTNGRNIRYWRARQHYHEAQGNVGVAETYLRQIDEWQQLQNKFTRRLQQENLLETTE